MTPTSPLRVLFLCTQNAARSQIAEAILNARHDPRAIAGSAGTRPADRVNPFAMEVISALGPEPGDRRPKGVDEVQSERWDLVVTVCDSARESCPIFPGSPATVHWSVPDPAGITGDEETRRAAFRDTASLLGRRISLLLALPLEELRGAELQSKAREIARAEAAGKSGRVGS